MAQLEKIGALDNTLFFYIVGDNGSSAEGGPEGTYNEMMALNGIVGKAEQMMDHIDDVGRSDDVPALRHRLGVGGQHAVPVDQAGRQSLRRHAQRHGDALAEGDQSQGRNPQPVPPRHRRGADRARSGEDPAAQDGQRRRRSARWTACRCSTPTDDAKAADRRTTQYFEMFGNRGIYHEGWVACTRHSIPWLMAAKLPPLKDDVWELYNVDEDFSQANNLAAKNPAKLKELQAVFPEGSRAQPRAADR